MKAFEKFYFFVAVLFSLTVLFLNLRLYSTPGSDFAEISPHLQFLKQQLESGSATEMQALFPEGYLFNYVLYGASWIDMGIADSRQKESALREARWALGFLESDTAKVPFQRTLEPPLGVFYLGWINWLRGGILKLDRSGTEMESFQRDCQILSESFAKSKSPYLKAYPGEAWPCDSTVAVAALALHDTLYEPRFQTTIEHWLSGIQSTEVDGLLPHKAPTGVDGEVHQEAPTAIDILPTETAPSTDMARGSSQVMILRFLYEVDPTLAQRYYATFRERYVTTQFGLPGAREYPVGTDGVGDVDSGPLILGFSLSATGVLPGAARLQGDQELLRPFEQLIATFGFPVRGRYLFGEIPVADALLVWSRTAVSWTGKPRHEQKWSPIVGWWWRWGFHGFWLVVVALVWLPLCVRRSWRCLLRS